MSVPAVPSIAAPVPGAAMACTAGFPLAPGAPARRRVLGLVVAPLLAAAGCATPRPSVSPAPSAHGAAASVPPSPAPDPVRAALLLDRVAGGASASSMRELAALGEARWLDAQLRADPSAPPPAPLAARLAALPGTDEPLEVRLAELARLRRGIQALPTEAERVDARRAYQQALAGHGRAAASRSLLRALYSPTPLLEQMTWFWSNHFSVFAGKADLRAMVGDFEQRAIRPHALGRFRDLLGAAVRHPAMLRYLDNAANASGRLNENLARELLELHTLGVDGGYAQADVQELARVLTGVGIAAPDRPPAMRPAPGPLHVREGAFEFLPARHDFGDKRVLGRTIRGRGLAELDEVLDLLAAHPSTARHVARRIATFLVADVPDAALVARLADAFTASGGEVAAVLRTLFASREFDASLGAKFKDPTRWVVSAVRLAWDEAPIADPVPMLGWLNRLGQPLFGRPTPDGWPLDEASWTGSGQMDARFEIARVIGAGAPALFRDAAAPAAAPPAPRLAGEVFDRAIRPRAAPATLAALDRAGGPAQWNALLLSSPEFMRR
jgi:uncharacterized protein (DUF1800 family)